MKTIVRLTYLALSLPAFALLAACGGGGGGTVAGPAPAGPVAPPVGPLVTIPIHGMTPALMAYQSGTSGAWKKVTPTGGNVTFNLAVGATAYSLAAYCPPNNSNGSIYRNGPAEIIIQATTTDTPSMFCHPPSSGVASVNATLFVEANAFPNTDHVGVSQISNAIGSPNAGFGGAAGADEVGSPLWYSGASDIVLQVTNATPVLIAARIVRGSTFTPNTTMTLDPLSPTADAATTVPVTTPAGTTNGLIFWQPAEGGNILMGSGPAPTLPLIPNAISGDSYEVGGVGSVGGQFTIEATAGATPSAITLPAYPSTVFTLTGPVSEPDLFSVNCAYMGFTVSGTKYYSTSPYWLTTAPQQIVAPGAPLVTQVASQSYLGTGTTLTFPDLSSIPGFLPTPTGGLPVSVIANDYAVSGPFSWDNMTTGNSFFYAPLAPGSTFQADQSTYVNFNAP